MFSKVLRIFRFARPSFLRNYIFKIRLVYHLMRDRRVSLILKIIPLAVMAYLVLPDFIPFRIDDFIVFNLGMSGFVRLCPKPVVREYSDRISREMPA